MRRRAPTLALLLVMPCLAMAQPGPPGDHATPVEAVAVTVQALNAGLSSVGTLVAEDAVVIRPEIAGIIDKMHVADGARVKAGEPLYSLESQLLRAEHNEAAANIERSRRSYARAEDLAKRQLIARSEYDDAKANLGVDKARLTSAAIRLAKTTIRAPFDGIVGLHQVSLGDYVEVGQAMVNLVRLDPMQVDFRVPENHLAQVTPGQRVDVRIDAFPGKAFSGQVIALDPQVDVASRSVLVRASVANKESLLRPGLFARVDVVLARQAAAILVPERALWPIADHNYVFRVRDGKAQQVEVRTGQRLPGMVEIAEGLQPGDVVITAGQPKVHDGAAVQVAAPKAPSGAAVNQ